MRDVFAAALRAGRIDDAGELPNADKRSFLRHAGPNRRHRQQKSQRQPKRLFHHHRTVLPSRYLSGPVLPVGCRGFGYVAMLAGPRAVVRRRHAQARPAFGRAPAASPAAGIRRIRIRRFRTVTPSSRHILMYGTISRRRHGQQICIPLQSPRRCRRKAGTPPRVTPPALRPNRTPPAPCAMRLPLERIRPGGPAAARAALAVPAVFRTLRRWQNRFNRRPVSLSRRQEIIYYMANT